MRLTAITIVFNALCTFQIGVIAGFKQFKRISQNQWSCRNIDIAIHIVSNLLLWTTGGNI